MGAALLAAMFLHASTVIYSSVHIERIGSASVSKNCDDKPCYQGKCENEKCRCFAGWGGVQCDRCHGRNLLTDENELLTDGPRNYSSSSRCMWIIKDEKKEGALLLRIDSLVTECSWDHLYIYDGTGTRGHQLAAFSGVISGREVSIKSGKALVYFFSDLAFNMSGFNITFAYGKCPNNCTSNGKCIEGVCGCYEGYTGAQCDTLICTDKDRNKTSRACGMAGICGNDNRCDCNMHFHGIFLHRGSLSSFDNTVGFETVLTSGDFGGRASYTAVLVNDTKIWVIGGAHFTGVNNSFVAVYDITNSSWSEIPTKILPNHSTIYMFGGVIDERVVTNELWSLDLGTLEWTLENTNNNASDAVPGAVAGHAAHLIGDEMLVFYGHSPYFGYMYSTRRWSIVPDYGPHLQGRFGHSLVAYVHEKKEIILIYGGYLLPYEGSLSRVSSTLIEYVCDNRECSHRTLSSGHTPVFRHSASLINDLMIIIGGNVHNESSARIQECYSGDIQAYDIGCDTWFSLSNNNLSFCNVMGTHHWLQNTTFLSLVVSMDMELTTVFTAECGGLKRPDDCRNMREGVRCIFHAGKCKSVQRDVSYAHSFLSYVKNEDPKEEQKCPISWRKSASWCSEEKDCAACTAAEGCSWCQWNRECVSDNLCKDRTNPVVKSDACPKDEEPRPCFFAAEYLLLEGEVPQQHHYSQSEHTSSFALNALNPSSKNESCPAPCWFHDDCQICIKEQCMWCPTTARCVSMDAYMINFPYGQCQSWVTATNIVSNQHACQLDPMDCSKQKTCAECQRVGPNCGWCDDGSGTGLGRCLPGSLEAPDNELLCPKDGKSKWYFTNCSVVNYWLSSVEICKRSVLLHNNLFDKSYDSIACQCNGHSNCTLRRRSLEWNIEEQSCTQCDHNTTGEHCQFCADGFYGDPRNGGRCEECFCNGQAKMCNRETGDCYCTTKGVTGKNCSKCEPKYYGDPENNQLCYYELTVDFIFTFKLDQDDPKDKYVNQINFFSTPHKRDTDVQFTVVCESPKLEKALVSMSINSSFFEGHPSSNKLLMTRTVCDESGIRRAYSANAEPGFIFGTDANTTFLVKVYNFSTPIKIQISFSQSPPINWVCFVVLLVVAGLLWMIKLRIEVFRRNQRRYDEIEQMASRPFASVRLELTSPRANLMATPISVEPCSNYRSGVFTLAVRLPTGGRQFTPHGTSGLAVASALCLLTQAQLGVLQAAETSDANHNRKTTLMRYIPFIRS
ncbi:Kelch domain-containing protein family protein [Dirofilaria immitis]|nr:Kelch domain-containing protein family protein [Dirofilaria immitis]